MAGSQDNEKLMFKHQRVMLACLSWEMFGLNQNIDK